MRTICEFMAAAGHEGEACGMKIFRVGDALTAARLILPWVMEV